MFTALLGPALMAGIVTTVGATVGQFIAAAPELLPALAEGFRGWEPPGAT